MAENLETPSFGNFSIENTMERGLGSAELLNDLLGPDTASANPEDIKGINEPDPISNTAPKVKVDAAPADVKGEDASKSIQDFLLGGDDDDDDDDDNGDDTKPPVVKTPKDTAAPGEETNDNDDDDDSTNQFTALSRDLLKLGVFTTEEDGEETPINSAEEFLERFEVEKKKGAIEVVQNFIGQFGEDYQNAFDAIFVKGVDPKEYFGTYNAIESFSEMDLSQESNQIAIIKQALADQGFDPEDITTEVERLQNYGDLESVAGKHHKVLVKKEAAKLQKLEQDRTVELQRQAAYKQQYQQNVTTVLQEKLKTKEFDGIPLNPKLAGELQDFLLAEKWKTGSGETLTDFDKTILDLKRPEKHEMKVKVALLLKILEKDPTLSTIQKSGISKKSSELFGEVARQASKSSVKSKSPASSSWFQ